jgi:hypothetical protein
MENDKELIENEQNPDQRIFDETYLLKYTKRRNIFKYFLFINTCICFIVIILYIFRIIKNEGMVICFIFFSMMIFHVVGMVHSGMYWYDFIKQKNGESEYLKNYYPDIWEKINPYGEIIIGSEYLKYENGKSIPKNVDPIIDKIRNDKKNNIIYILPFILMLLFIIIIIFFVLMRS